MKKKTKETIRQLEAQIFDQRRRIEQLEIVVSVMKSNANLWNQDERKSPIDHIMSEIRTRGLEGDTPIEKKTPLPRPPRH